MGKDDLPSLKAIVAVQQGDTGFEYKGGNFTLTPQYIGHFMRPETEAFVKGQPRTECGFGCDWKPANRAKPTNVDLGRHELTHCGDGYQCSECPKCFKQKSQLNTHLRAKHSGQAKFACHGCAKQFTDQSSAHRHERVGKQHKYFNINGKPRVDSTRTGDAVAKKKKDSAPHPAPQPTGQMPLPAFMNPAVQFGLDEIEAENRRLRDLEYQAQLDIDDANVFGAYLTGPAPHLQGLPSTQQQFGYQPMQGFVQNAYQQFDQQYPLPQVGLQQGGFDGPFTQAPQMARAPVQDLGLFPIDPSLLGLNDPGPDVDNAVDNFFADEPIDNPLGFHLADDAAAPFELNAMWEPNFDDGPQLTPQQAADFFGDANFDA